MTNSAIFTNLNEIVNLEKPRQVQGSQLPQFRAPICHGPIPLKVKNLLHFTKTESSHFIIKILFSCI
jgi:hypothetical protein